MNRLSFSLAGIVFVMLLFAQFEVAQKAPGQGTSVADRQVRSILVAKGPSDASQGYHSLFKSATADDLRRLQMNPSDTIAIQAAWEEVELSVPEKPERVVRPDRDKLSRFIGFLEGRARLQAPRWWTDAILDARANCRSNVYAGGLNMAEDEKKPNTAAPPRQAKFDKLESKPVIRVGSESAPIPEDLREKLGADKLAHGVGLITASHCYVAMHDNVGYGYRLACLERSSAKVRWIADVWACWWGAVTGSHQQWVELTEQDNRVAVFGIASVGFYVEAFRVDDGGNVLRFSNSYSGWWGDSP